MGGSITHRCRLFSSTNPHSVYRAMKPTSVRNPAFRPCQHATPTATATGAPSNGNCAPHHSSRPAATRIDQISSPTQSSPEDWVLFLLFVFDTTTSAFREKECGSRETTPAALKANVSS
ncbi:Uncharacterised protein [Mycobacteroides abscessus subsp. abscessus]|nr:Uncharacterised protein [Mycobacteroides abscessus subsp. abscessus]